MASYAAGSRTLRGRQRQTAPIGPPVLTDEVGRGRVSPRPHGRISGDTAENADSRKNRTHRRRPSCQATRLPRLQVSLYIDQLTLSLSQLVAQLTVAL